MPEDDRDRDVPDEAASGRRAGSPRPPNWQVNELDDQQDRRRPDQRQDVERGMPRPTPG